MGKKKPPCSKAFYSLGQAMALSHLLIASRCPTCFSKNKVKDLLCSKHLWHEVFYAVLSCLSLLFLFAYLCVACHEYTTNVDYWYKAVSCNQ